MRLNDTVQSPLALMLPRYWSPPPKTRPNTIATMNTTRISTTASPLGSARQLTGSSLVPVLDRLEALEAEYSQVLARLSDPTLSQDPNELRVLSRRHKELEVVVRKMHELKAAQEDVAVAP